VHLGEAKKVQAEQRRLVATEADAVDGTWEVPSKAFPVFERPGAREFLLRAAAAGYELILWSRREEHLTNVGLHPIDPDLTLFPLTHRFYSQDDMFSSSLHANRDPANLVFVDCDHWWRPHARTSWVPIPRMRGPPHHVALLDPRRAGNDATTSTLLVADTAPPPPDAHLKRLWDRVLEPLAHTAGDVRLSLPNLLNVADAPK
jgi:hypothetical protein